MESPLNASYILCIVLAIFALHFQFTCARCYDPTPPYPTPVFRQSHPRLRYLFTSLERELSLPAPQNPALDVKFSVEVTSAEETLWSFHQSAVSKSQDARGEDVGSGSFFRRSPFRGSAPVGSVVRDVDEYTVYRLASITKVFTVLAALQAQDKGLLHLDAPITEYVEELRGYSSEKPSRGIRTEWERITLRSLANQLSGIQRDSAKMTPVWDLSTAIRRRTDPVKIGFPPLKLGELPACGDATIGFQCSRKEFLKELHRQMPVYEPNFKSRYSNIAYVLLGMALENVTQTPYNKLIQTWIFDPLNMTDASIEKPYDSRGAIVGKGSAWWSNLGQYNATGGAYASTSSLSAFIRHVLNTPDLANSWLHPASFNPGSASSYGMPWEIYHSARFLPAHGRRPTTFYTKSGGLAGYSTNIIILPEQGLGITILVAGGSDTRPPLPWIREAVTRALVPAAEDTALEYMAARYAGRYVYRSGGETHGPRGLDSEMSLRVGRTQGLHVTRWISNGTDFLEHVLQLVPPLDGAARHAQAIPSMLFEQGRGEVWRLKLAAEKRAARAGDLWDEFCFDDVQGFAYGGKEVNELIFETEDGVEGGRVEALTIEGLRVRLERVEDDGEASSSVLEIEQHDVQAKAMPWGLLGASQKALGQTWWRKS